MTTNRARAASRSILVAAVLSTALLSAACGSSGPANHTGAVTKTADGATVNTGLLAFSPETVSIRKGQTVTWVGGDNIAHVLVEGSYQVGTDKLRTEQTDDKAFTLDLTKSGQKVSHTYDAVGTFTYYCTIHHGMNGTVVVS
jgi:plastocyanin